MSDLIEQELSKWNQARRRTKMTTEDDIVLIDDALGIKIAISDPGGFSENGILCCLVSIRNQIELGESVGGLALRGSGRV
jgi:hypothetical protein